MSGGEEEGENGSHLGGESGAKYSCLKCANESKKGKDISVYIAPFASEMPLFEKA